MATLPSPADYPDGGFMDAYRAYRVQVDAENDAAFLATLAEAGARTTACPCGYTPFDTCPVHD